MANSAWIIRSACMRRYIRSVHATKYSFDVRTFSTIGPMDPRASPHMRRRSMSSRSRRPRVSRMKRQRVPAAAIVKYVFSLVSPFLGASLLCKFFAACLSWRTFQGVRKERSLGGQRHFILLLVCLFSN
jgi:hypothetical protein